MITNQAPTEQSVPSAVSAPGQTVTALYIGSITLGLPLVMHHGYFDITETKFVYYLLVSAVYVLTMSVLRLAGAKRDGTGRRLLPATLCMGAFVAAFFAASLLSGHFGEALLGANNRYQGLITVFLYGAVFLWVSRNFAFTRWNAVALTMGFCLVCLLAVLNDFGLDPLGAYRNLRPGDEKRYLSTLGNSNFFGGYVGAVYPVLLAGWCLSEKRRLGLLYGVGLAFGNLALRPSGSDSLGLALLAAYVLLPLFCMDNPAALTRCLLALLALLLTAQAQALMAGLWGSRFYPPFFLRLLCKPAVWGSLVGLCLLLLLRLHLQKGWNPLRAKRRYLLGLGAVALLAALGLVLVNTLFAHRSFGVWGRFLRFDGSWGTDRGQIWAYCLRLYGDFSPLAKLLGGGPGRLYRLDMAHPLFPDAILDSAHNEYLQYLLTIGLLGLAAYLGLLLTAALSVLRQKNRNPAALGFLLGALCYGAQAMVSIAQPASTPFLFLLLGMAVGSASYAGTAALSTSPMGAEMASFARES